MNDSFMPDISLDGFQVVRAAFFTHQAPPSLTIWDKAISFNCVAYQMLNNCESIQIMCNDANRSILISPAVTKDSEAIVWKRHNADPPKYRKIECTNFSKPLLDRWRLDPKYRYRATGRLVQADRKVMLLFDFRTAEIWDGKALVKPSE